MAEGQNPRAQDESRGLESLEEFGGVVVNLGKGAATLEFADDKVFRGEKGAKVIVEGNESFGDRVESLQF